MHEIPSLSLCLPQNVSSSSGAANTVLRHPHSLFPPALSVRETREKIFIHIFLFDANALTAFKPNHRLPDSVQAIKSEMAKQPLGSFYSPNMNRECRKMFHSICDAENWWENLLKFQSKCLASILEPLTWTVRRFDCVAVQQIPADDIQSNSRALSPANSTTLNVLISSTNGIFDSFLEFQCEL